ncbi:hypothetical protein ACVILH_001809 [Bradyrhizobium sp. USDA 4353]
MRPATAPWITLGATFERGGRIGDLRLRAGDEGRQAVDPAVGDDRLRLRLILRRLRTFAMLARLPLAMLLRLAVLTRLASLSRLPMLAGLTMLAGFAVLARLLLIALIGLLIVATLALTAVTVAHEGLGLRLRLNEARLLAEMREALAVIVEIVDGQIIGCARLRLVLTELLLGRRDQAEIMLGVLIVVFGGNGVARGAGVTGKLDVFFGHMGGGATDLDVRPVGLEHPGQRILAAPVIVVVTVVAVAHPLVVLTVSHVLPLFQPCVRSTDCQSIDCHQNTDAVLKYRPVVRAHGARPSPVDAGPDLPVPTHADVIDSRFARQKRVQNAFPTHRLVRPANHVIQPARASFATTDPVCFA